MDKNVLDVLFDKQNKIDNEKLKIVNAIKSLQELCEHKWDFVSSGHNDSMFKCSICRKEKFE